MVILKFSLLGRLSRGRAGTVECFIRNFSRKHDSSKGPYKIVKGRVPPKDENRLAGLDPNFELLASNTGFPFILPGNVGLAWYNSETTTGLDREFVMEQISEGADLNGHIVCRVQPCPTVLRKTVGDLFPYRNFENSELSVVTISLKTNIVSLRKNSEIETERMAQTFVVTAKTICDKLRRSGYWADFINPFSGKPYLFPTFGDALYEADEKFRCMDFQIFDIQQCKIISNEQDTTKKRFIGSLFTNAAAKKTQLNSIFSQ